MSETFIIYTKEGCGYCKKAKELLSSKGISYKDIPMTSENKERIYKKIDKLTNNYRYFPIIFREGEFIGGYTELSNMKIEIPDGGSHVDKTSFKGTAKYNIKAMKYLSKKHKNHCVIIPETNLKKSVEHSEVSLRWNQTKEYDGYISIPKGFWKAVDKCKGSKRFVIFPFGFTCSDGSGHANYMIYDSKNKSLERFEPYGYKESDCINAPDLDENIRDMMQKKWEIREYYKPLDFIPMIGVQTIQRNEYNEKKGDPVGFCSVWAAWYADLRLTNPDTPRDILVKKAITELQNRPENFTQFARNYSAKLT